MLKFKNIFIICLVISTLSCLTQSDENKVEISYYDPSALDLIIHSSSFIRLAEPEFVKNKLKSKEISRKSRKKVLSVGYIKNRVIFIRCEYDKNNYTFSFKNSRDKFTSLEITYVPDAARLELYYGDQKKYFIPPLDFLLNHSPENKTSSLVYSFDEEERVNSILMDFIQGQAIVDFTREGEVYKGSFTSLQDLVFPVTTYYSWDSSLNFIGNGYYTPEGDRDFSKKHNYSEKEIRYTSHGLPVGEYYYNSDGSPAYPFVFKSLLFEDIIADSGLHLSSLEYKYSNGELTGAGFYYLKPGSHPPQQLYGEIQLDEGRVTLLKEGNIQYVIHSENINEDGRILEKEIFEGSKALYRRVYNDKEELISEETGTGNTYISKTTYNYDHNGCLTKRETTGGGPSYSAEYSYDSRGYLTKIARLNDEQHRTHKGFDVEVHSYNEVGNILKSVYYDELYNPVLTLEGYHKKVIQYSSKGFIHKESWYGTEGEPEFYQGIRGAYAVILTDYEKGFMKKSWLGKEGEPVSATELSKIYEFNNRVFIEKRFLDFQNSLILNPFYLERTTLDSRGRIIRRDYLDVKGELVPVFKDGLAFFTVEYDPRGYVQRIEYYNKSGKATPRSPGGLVVAEEFVYNILGNLEKKIQYDKKGRVVN